MARVDGIAGTCSFPPRVDDEQSQAGLEPPVGKVYFVHKVIIAPSAPGNQKLIHTMSTHKVLIAGAWRAADSSGSFQALNPATGESLADHYPISNWADCDAALSAAQQAFEGLRQLAPQVMADFLDAYAVRIEARAGEITELANHETALAVEPRLASIELPRTTSQMRQAATACREGHWTHPVIDTAAGIRTQFGPIGPVCVFGPNNFPLAFGSVSGGDFVAAIAAGNPVIAKAHPLHPGTSRLLAEEAQAAAKSVGLPAGTVQLLYDMSHADGERLAQDHRLAAIAFTGSRHGGLKLKAAADAVGKPIFLELGSINPVVILPGALAEKGEALADEFTGSCLMGTGQFCTSPGMLVLQAGERAEAFVNKTVKGFAAAPSGVLFSESGRESLATSVQRLHQAGAQILTGGTAEAGDAPRYTNTVLRVSGADFLASSTALQGEAFGNATLIVMTENQAETSQVLNTLEGNLTGCIYSATDGSDDPAYDELAPIMRQRVGRLLNDKMPTGVAVSPAMNHGGPFPATAQAGFSAVGIPGALLRFAMLQCYDNVRPERLPLGLRDQNPGELWRQVDGRWTQSSL